MLTENLVELYHILNDAKNINKEIKTLKNDILDKKEEAEEYKKNIIDILLKTNNDYIVYKNMAIALVEKNEKSKQKMSEIHKTIEEIIEKENLNTSRKRELILKLLKPTETGKKIHDLKIKFT